MGKAPVILLAVILALGLIPADGQEAAPDPKAQTKDLLFRLEMMCEDYRTEFGAYPPTREYSGSAALHWYLGRDRKILVRRGQDGSPDEVAVRPPLMHFPAELLEGGKSIAENGGKPSRVLDAWKRPIRYRCPAYLSKSKFDLWSEGPDPARFDDDLVNWEGGCTAPWLKAGTPDAGETRKILDQLTTALKMYELDQSGYPESGNASMTRALHGPHPTGSYWIFKHGMLSEDGELLDPWGHPYVYRNCKGAADSHNKRGIDLHSFGPDGKDDQGGGDDINNWG